jgi:nicotinamide phosphoribosyltransferase
MRNLSAMLLCDFYKLSHREQYPEGTEVVYSTWTPRASRMNGVNQIVSFGQQAFVKEYLMDFFNENFFSRPKSEVVNEYKRILKHTLGVPDPSTTHIEELHDLGFLPLVVKALPEGTLVPLRTPMMTIENTDKRFFWLTNYIESLASCELWQASTSATIAYEYRKLLDKFANETSTAEGFTQFQGHDFSMRGMSSLKSAINSGMGHLLSFVGTDTVPAIQALEYFYGANVEKELVGTSIPATEHSVQCAYGNDEVYLERMFTEVVPTGFVSIVSDGYDFWNVIGVVLPKLKDKIMARDGKVVIRPDSGDPVKILTGNPEGDTELERKGTIEALWDTFGGTVNSKGYKELDPHIGCIYGDAITLERAETISRILKNKGFASTNVVYGIGSYTYQMNTRDTFGFALKSTLCVINGDEKMIFKDPKTDNGIKKSQKGAVIVYRDEDGLIQFSDMHTLDEVEDVDGINMLTTIFENGRLARETTLADIRARLAAQ